MVVEWVPIATGLGGAALTTGGALLVGLWRRHADQVVADTNKELTHIRGMEAQTDREALLLKELNYAWSVVEAARKSEATAWDVAKKSSVAAQTTIVKATGLSPEPPKPEVEPETL